MTSCFALSSCYEHSHFGAYTYMLMFLQVAKGLKIVHSKLRPFLSFAPLVLQKYSLRPEKQFPDALRKIERQQSHSESEVLQMQTETIDKSQQATPQIEEELIDTLIAISVVAKRLAANLRQQNKENGGTENEQNE